MPSLAQTLDDALEIFNVTECPALLLSYDVESHEFELWDFLTPGKCADFFVRDTRVALCKIVPADLKQGLNSDEWLSVQMYWQITACIITRPPLSVTVTQPHRSIK